MNLRRFQTGEFGTVLGLDYRVMTGKKQARRQGWDDLRLEWRVPTWTPISMHWLYLGTDFLTENEDALFPPENNYRGGEYLMDEIRRVRNVGWLHVSQSLDIEITRSLGRDWEDAA